MSIKGIIFDLDGTLTDTLSLCVRGFRAAVEPLAGRRFSDEQIIATFGPSEEGTIMALVPERYDEGLAAYLAAYKRLLAEGPQLFDGVRELLSALRIAGTPLALVTGKGMGSTELTLNHYGLTDFFTTVATGSPQGSVKAQRIAEITADWRFEPHQVLYVGDATSDIVAAREAGVKIASAAWAPEADAAALTARSPDAVLSSVAELTRWLQNQDADRIVKLAQQVQALAQTGLTFTRDRYDIERYETLRSLSTQMMEGILPYAAPTLHAAFAAEPGYATPKVDVRAIVLRQGSLLMLREADDGLWSLPGGWADVGDRPSDAIRREVWEETGLEVSVDRLLGLWDRNLHGHPPYPYHVYKLIFLCTERGGEITLNADALEIGFFDPAALPPLSLTRIVPAEIEGSLASITSPGPAYFD